MCHFIYYVFSHIFHPFDSLSFVFIVLQAYNTVKKIWLFSRKAEKNTDRHFPSAFSLYPNIIPYTLFSISYYILCNLFSSNILATAIDAIYLLPVALCPLYNVSVLMFPVPSAITNTGGPTLHPKNQPFPAR